MMNKAVCFALLLLVLLCAAGAYAAGDPAARIGETRYDTLQAAINASQSGDTIVMLRNVTEDIVIPGYDADGNVRADKPDLTLEMDYFTLTSANDTDLSAFVHITSGADVTIRNGTLTGVTADKMFTLYLGEGELHAENVTFRDNCPHMPKSARRYTAGAIYTYVSMSSGYAKDPLTGAYNGGAVLDLKDCRFEDNKPTYESSTYLAAGVLYAAGARNGTQPTNLEITIDGCTFKGNASKRYSCLYMSNNNTEPAPIVIKDCLFEGNTLTGTTVSAVVCSNTAIEITDTIFRDNLDGAVYSRDTLTMTGCQVLRNQSPSTSSVAGGVTASGTSMTLRDCRIAGNSHATYYGGVSTSTTESLLSNTVITGNSGGRIGGLYTTSGKNVVFDAEKPGAVYGNTTTAGDAYAGHDIAFSNQFGSGNTVSIPAAADMQDSGVSFKGYKWLIHSKADGVDLYVDGGLGVEHTATAPRTYTAVYAQKRYIVRNLTTDKLYESLGTAVSEATSGDTLRLVAGDPALETAGLMRSASIAPEKTIVEPTVIDKKLTLDLNSRKLYSSHGATLTVAGTGDLTIIGDGEIDAASGNAAIVNNGKLTLHTEASAVVGDIEANTSDTTLLSNAQLGTIILAKDKTVTASKEVTNELTFAIDDEQLAELNACTTLMSVPLVVPQPGSTLSESLSNSVEVEGSSRKVVVKFDEEGNVQAQNAVITGIFLNGQSGNDANDGLSLNKAVRTFARAKQVLKANSGVNVIYITGAVSVLDTQSWSLADAGEGASLLRHPSYKGSLVSVSGDLTLSDVVIDGNRDAVAAQGAIVTVGASGQLTIRDGAKLIDNQYTGTSGFGGAVHSLGKVVMTGGEISGNEAAYGGGIHLYTEKASLIMSGGRITGNKASKVETGVGGIAGGVYADVGSVLRMTGGEVSGNEAPYQGGGIYIQCEAKGYLSGGRITGNRSVLMPGFAGGGLYVNGTRTTENDETFEYGELFLSNTLITGNNASHGGGYAGCETSFTDAFTKDGVAVFSNTAEHAASNELFFETVTSNLAKPTVRLSDYMLGGGAYNWIDKNGNRLESGSVARYDAFGSFSNAPSQADKDRASALAQLTISGNSANGFGGGIASNGTVHFGEEEDVLQIPVTKLWVDEGLAEELIRDEANNRYLLRRSAAATIHPASFKVWLVRNGEDSTFLEFKRETVTVDGEEYYAWPITKKFVDVPKKDANGRNYTYTVREELPAGAAYSVEVRGDVTGFVITNTFAPTGTVILTAQKRVDGRIPTAGEVFTFTLTGEGVSQTKQNVGGAVTFDPIAYTLADIGTHTYTIRESAAEGYETDPSVYTVTVTVTLNGSALNAQVTSIRRDGAEADAVVFDNEHIIDGTQIVLTAQKRVDGREPAAGEVFTFALTGDGVSQTKQNAGGMVTFDPITYSEGDEGEHVYTITEQAKAGYMTDPSVYTVTVTVTVGEDYALNAQITSIKRNGAEADAVLFENTIPEAEIRLTARKTVNGDAPAAGEVFTFRLLGEGVDMTASNVGGEIVFDPIGYTGRDAGRRFTYTIHEEAAAGYITDETVYTVVVAVEQNADGSLAARVESIRGGEGNEILFRNEREKEDVVPKTGDESSMALYALLCLGAAAGLVMMRKRRAA